MGLTLLLRYLSVSVAIIDPQHKSIMRFGPKFAHRPTDQVGFRWVLVTGRFASVADLAGLADFVAVAK